MSNSDADDLTDSDFDPDEEYANQWPEKNNESENNSSASEESENESDDEQEGITTSETFPNVLKKLTHNYILEIYEILDARKETNFKNALAINKEMQNKLIMIRTQIQALHSKVVNRYAQNEERLIDNMSTKKERKKAGIFGRTTKGRTFFIRGNTYFKDENARVFCPNNEDYTRRSKNGEIFPMDFELVARHIWSITDKMAIVKGIKEQIIAEKSLQVRVSNKNTQLITLLEKVGKDFKIDWTQISAHNLSYRHTPSSCKAIWDVYLQPELKHDSFSTAENERLMQAIEKHKFQNWNAIAKEVGKRSDYQCFLHYHTTMFCRGRWTRWDKKDDKLLLQAIEAAKCNGVINWSQVTFQFPQKSKGALQQRYLYTINPAVSHAPFTAHEDLLLLAAVQEYGTNFAKIPRSLFPNRSVIQLRTRYNNTLQNRHKITAWTLEDDQLLMEFVRQNGVSSWKKLEETFENRHTRISCRQRYLVIQKHLSRDANATLEQIARKKCRQLRSDVTPKNWQQKVEELRTNPTNLQIYEDKTVAKKRKRKQATSAKKSKPNKHAKIHIELEDKELENTIQELELNNEMETIVDRTTTTDSVKENTVLNAKFDMLKTVQNHICDISKVKESEKIASATNLNEKTNQTSVIVYYGIDGHKNKSMRQTKKPIYVERLRANGLRFHDFLKYSYNFRFGREPVSSCTYRIEELDKAKECLGFQMPSLKDLSSLARVDSTENLNGLCVSVEFRQRLKNFISNSVKSGTTLEPAHSNVPPNFSTLATLRSLCVLSTDYAKKKKKLSKLAENNDCAEVPISSKNIAAIERFRQRFRNLFYEAAVLSRLPPSSLENQSLKNPSTYPTEFYRPVINNTKKVNNSAKILNVVKNEYIGDEAELPAVIKTEIEIEIDKETNQECGYS